MIIKRKYGNEDQFNSFKMVFRPWWIICCSQFLTINYFLIFRLSEIYKVDLYLL